MNPRHFEVILRPPVPEALIVLALPFDERQFLPGPGEAKDLTLLARLPEHLSRGYYDLLVNLPDPAPALHDRPEYAIRLASKNTWQPATGFSDLHMKIAITP